MPSTRQALRTTVVTSVSPEPLPRHKALVTYLVPIADFFGIPVWQLYLSAVAVTANGSSYTVTEHILIATMPLSWMKC
eukprot:3319678-Amphidinium_carterae.1